MTFFVKRNDLIIYIYIYVCTYVYLYNIYRISDSWYIIIKFSFNSNKIKINMVIFLIKLISYLIMHVYILLPNRLAYIKLYCKINVDDSSRI